MFKIKKYKQLINTKGDSFLFQHYKNCQSLKWWNFKYLINDSNEVYRNPNISFLFPEPPVIENSDERIIILMASIIIKGGSLEENSWNVAETAEDIAEEKSTPSEEVTQNEAEESSANT